MNLIEIRDLSVAFNGQTVVNKLSLDVRPGECLALVGESGSGKSVTAHSILQLLPETGTETTGSIRYRGQELVGASASTLQKLRGNRIAMIFQEPMTSLNPLHSIEKRVTISKLLLLAVAFIAAYAASQKPADILSLVGIAFSLAEPIARALGKTGINVMTRLMGLILAALAVEVMADGLGKLFPVLGRGAL